MGNYAQNLLATMASWQVQSDEIVRSEEHTSELQSPCNLVCRLLLEKKKKITKTYFICKNNEQQRLHPPLNTYTISRSVHCTVDRLSARRLQVVEADVVSVQCHSSSE